MRLVMIGVNHRTAALPLREKLALSADDAADALRRLADRHPGTEAVVVSTCNRVEWYLAKPAHQPPTADDLRAFIAESAGLDARELAGATIHREQDQAAMHLFEVAAGLDSMVLGESQILGQVRRAYESASAAGTVGTVLHTVFQQAIASARRLRSTTGIGHGQQSIASVAADFIRQVFETLDDKTVLCVGAGEVGKLVARHVLGLGPGQVVLVNRSPERAEALAGTLGLSADRGGVRPWNDLDALLVEADVIISCTGADEPVVTAERFKQAVRKRRNRPAFILDAAVPRDVEPAVGALRNVYLYNLDDLEPVIERTMSLRAEEVERCRATLRGEVRMCMNQVQHQDIGRMVRVLRQRLHGIGDAERDRTIRKLRSVHPAGYEQQMNTLLDEHTRRLINKILHLPLSRLDHSDPEAPLGFYAAALRRLFDLEPEASDAPASRDDTDNPAPPAQAP